MMGKIISCVLLLVLSGSGYALAGGPLSVLYPEDSDDREHEVDSQQSYIDNQAYLREFEQQRRERVLHPPPQAPVGVIRKRERVRSFSPFQFPYYQSYSSDSAVGMEVHGGATSIRYYDGYRPNYYAPRYYYHPSPPVATPYRSRSGSRR